ncbi:MAG: HupE/UreJ family protein [Gemmatimonadales bacterium]
MEQFAVYLRLGIEHIADLRGYDHILFIIALTVGYQLHAWRKLTLLVTAFTVGHSITLALATLRIVNIDAALVEILIPATIIITALSEVVRRFGPETAVSEHRFVALRYALAAGFGLIHGLGFSTFLRAILGSERSIVMPLFGFNIGLEVGQLLIVTVVFCVSTIAVRAFKLPYRAWVLTLSSATALVALVMMIQRVSA